MNLVRFIKQGEVKIMLSKILRGIILSLSLMVISSQAWSAVTSYDNTFTADDIHAADFHTKLNRNFQQSLTGGINAIDNTNITDDSLTEADMADEINPRIRTYEGAACEFVYSGLLPVTDTDLTTDTSAGTAYPRGYRVNKASATSHTYTAEKWTWVDIDINGDFQYTELAIGSGTPSIASNSIRLARVSTDTTTVAAVQDLRTTSCTSGPFENISDATGEATLDDLFANGTPLRKSYVFGQVPQGYTQGVFASYDGVSQFTVTKGSIYINGKYRSVSADITVPVTADDPVNGISGIVSGSPAASTTYNIYAVADQDSVKDFSVSFGTSASGLTNYRLIGNIKTDPGGFFVSRDVALANGFSEFEIVGGLVVFNGGTIASYDSWNLSSITDNGTGDYTIAWDQDFTTNRYGLAGSAQEVSNNPMWMTISETDGQTQGAVRLEFKDDSNAARDPLIATVIAIGDTQK